MSLDQVIAILAKYVNLVSTVDACGIYDKTLASSIPGVRFYVLCDHKIPVGSYLEANLKDDGLSIFHWTPGHTWMIVEVIE